MKNSLKNPLPIVFALVLPTSFATAQSAVVAPPPPTELSLDDNFRGGRLETTFGAGTMFSPVGNPKNRPGIDYAVGDIQLGFMVTDPGADGFFRGNFEVVPEAFGAGIYHGPGNYIAGGTLWFRYNFVPHGWRVTPYTQLGGGFTFTDVERSLVGETFNFNLDAGAGLRYFVTPRCTVNLEYRFQHISNADLGPRNVGINAEGPFLGFSFFF